MVSHQNWHALFRNYTPHKIAEIINETWLDADFEFVVRRRELKWDAPFAISWTLWTFTFTGTARYTCVTDFATEEYAMKKPVKLHEWQQQNGRKTPTSKEEQEV